MKKILILTLFLTNLFCYEIVNGDTLIFKFDKNEIDSLSFKNKKIPLIENPQNSDELVAIVAANYRQKDDMILKKESNGQSENIIVKLKKGNYKSETLKVQNSKVNPPKSVQERIKNEYNEAVKIYAKTTPKYYFNKPFEVPLNSKITSNFGNARVFNGSLKSYHSGTDFRAITGTQITASNDGVVKIAKDRYYAGGSVIIDHGGGIYSQYYHLSKILVSPEQRIKKGELIGLSGATGRVSGAHLHFGIAINGTSVEPLEFIKKINLEIFDE